MINWSKHFDAIYCLSLADNKEKRQLASEDFDRVGILDSGVFRWKITVKNPFYKYIWSNPVLPAERWWLNIEGALNCTMGHYEIMKEALVMGYKHILIIEDDVRFLNDLDLLSSIVDNIPDYDILMLDKTVPVNKPLFFNARDNCKVNDLFFDFSTCKLLSCGCYGLSVKGMEYITKLEEMMWMPADSATNKVDNDGRVMRNDDLKRIASIPNAAVQDFHKKFYLDERHRDIDRIIYTGVADLRRYNVICTDQVL